MEERSRRMHEDFERRRAESEAYIKQMRKEMEREMQKRRSPR